MLVEYNTFAFVFFVKLEETLIYKYNLITTITTLYVRCFIFYKFSGIYYFNSSISYYKKLSIYIIFIKINLIK